MAYANLHIHSTVSDGTLTPEEIVRLCRENGVGALSVTDHDAVEGTLSAAPLARAAGLVYVCGVEIDTLWEGRDVHILCYGADFTNAALLSCIREARARMDKMSDTLLMRMLGDFPALSVGEYAAFERDAALGGWKMLHYLSLIHISSAAGETADALSDLKKRMENIGYRVTIARGDHRILPTGKQR